MGKDARTTPNRLIPVSPLVQTLFDATTEMCTLERRGNIFILTLIGEGEEHRCHPTVIDSIISSLRQAKSQATRGSVLLTRSTGKFFSNGFDLAWARSANSKSEAGARLHQMVDQFKPVAAELITLPMPTIAAVQGHAAAAGFLLAISHDYVLMRSDRGVLYMSEVDIGLPMPDYFAAMFRSKVGSVSARRDVLLRAMRVKGEDGVRMGIVDSAHNGEEALAEAAMLLAEQLAKRKWDGGVYKEIRKSLYPELCAMFGLVLEKPNPKL